LLFEDKIGLCVSSALLAEYRAVLERPKFAKYWEFAAKAGMVLENIEARLSFWIILGLSRNESPRKGFLGQTPVIESQFSVFPA